MLEVVIFILTHVNIQSGLYYMPWLVRNQRLTEERELAEHFGFI